MYLKKALKGSLFIFVVSLIAGLFGYGLRILLARSLSIVDYGLFYAMFSFFSFLSVFTDLGLSQAVTKHIVDFEVKGKFNKIRNLLAMSFSFQMLASAFLVLAFTLLAPFISSHFFHTSNTALFVAMGFWFLLVPLLTVLANVFSGFQRFYAYGSLELVRMTSIFVLTFILLQMDMQVFAPAFAYITVNLLMWVIYLPQVKRILPHLSKGKAKFEWQLFHSVFVYGLNLAVVGFIYTILTQTDTLMITYFLGLQAVGLYQVAVPLASLLLYIVNPILAVAFPMIAELHTRKDKKRMILGLSLIYRYIFYALVPCVIILTTFAPEAIGILFTQDYVPAATALRVLAVSAIFSALVLFNNTVLSAIGKPKEVMKVMVYAAILNILLNLVTIPLWGIVGASLSTLTSFIVACVLSMRTLKKEMTLIMPWRDWTLTMLFGVAGGLFMYVLNHAIHLTLYLKIAVVLIAFCAAYALGLYLTGLIHVEEIKGFLKLI